MTDSIIQALLWLTLIVFVLAAIGWLIKLFCQPSGSRRCSIKWENEQGKKGVIYIEAKRVKPHKDKPKRQTPKWLHILFNETPASLIEKRRRKKQRRN